MTAPDPPEARPRSIDLRRAAVRVLGAAAAFAFPQRCPGCAMPADPRLLLCDSCLARVPRLSFALCARCLARGGDGDFCNVHPHHAVWPAWIYDERAELVVHALKYGERQGLADELGAELARVAPPEPRPDLVIEVPLHSARRRERGYNQAELLALALAVRIGVPHLPRALERVRATRPQARLDPRARRANVSGAFRVTEPGWLKGRNVLIVDDVLTTGSTLDACLEALSMAGSRPVGVTLAWAQS